MDGTGKTTLSQSLAKYSLAKWVYEPDGKLPITKQLRDFCLQKEYKEFVNDSARELLLMANRAISFPIVQAYLDRGFSIVSDRSFLSGMVYAKVASGIEFEDWITAARLMNVQFPIIDTLVYVTTEKQRINKVEGDIYDNAKSKFHLNIKNAFEVLLERELLKSFVKDVIVFENDFSLTKEQNTEKLLRKLEESGI